MDLQKKLKYTQYTVKSLCNTDEVRQQIIMDLEKELKWTQNAVMTQCEELAVGTSCDSPYATDFVGDCLSGG